MHAVTAESKQGWLLRDENEPHLVDLCGWWSALGQGRGKGAYPWPGAELHAPGWERKPTRVSSLAGRAFGHIDSSTDSQAHGVEGGVEQCRNNLGKHRNHRLSRHIVAIAALSAITAFAGALSDVDALLARSSGGAQRARGILGSCSIGSVVVAAVCTVAHFVDLGFSKRPQATTCDGGAAATAVALAPAQPRPRLRSRPPQSESSDHPGIGWRGRPVRSGACAAPPRPRVPRRQSSARRLATPAGVAKRCSDE
mmetsp:Transcript_58342/g.125347  ORF Transcript_58342/g.125347 Transcript_58342/m.125347 type:complete len:254 (+) Transcript_58342:1538-2299(+)